MSGEQVDLNDELLSAYLDDELDGVTRSRLEQALRQDAGARERLDSMRSADLAMQRAFTLSPRAAHDPLIERIDNRRMPPRVVRRRMVWISGLAAGIGGLALGYLLSALIGRSEFPSLQANSALAKALETQASGEQPGNGPTATRMVLTFRASDGNYCRVFELRVDLHDSQGIACREETQWQLRGLDASASHSRGFQTASGSAIIDGVMDRLGGEDALSTDKERWLLEHGWNAATQP